MSYASTIRSALALVALIATGAVIAQTPTPAPATPRPAATFVTTTTTEKPEAALPTVADEKAAVGHVPAAPKRKPAPVYTGEDLSRVPQVAFEEAPRDELSSEQWQKRKGPAVAAALHLNARKEDGFLKALIEKRRDLAGLPFVMGDKCRTKGERAKAFIKAVKSVHDAPEKVTSEYVETIKKLATDKEVREEVTPEQAKHLLHAHLAAAVQVLMPANRPNHGELVRYLSTVARPDATRELARVAVFSPQKEAREAALKALAIRRERDSTEVLVSALRYPWPQVARNAAEAIVKLERKDLMPQLVDMLDEKDPRGPREETVDGKKVTVVRELVRINHHRNCMLCHAPVEREKTSDKFLAADIPLPSDPLPQPRGGYGSTSYGGRPQSDLIVRLDVTYLRQDFSMMQEVDEKSAWPTSQRFDFVVRKRELTEAEAKDLRERLEKREPGVLSPYQKAAVTALRELSGRDLEAKAEVWRKFLKLKSP